MTPLKPLYSEIRILQYKATLNGKYISHNSYQILLQILRDFKNCIYMEPRRPFHKIFELVQQFYGLTVYVMVLGKKFYVCAPCDPYLLLQ